MKIINNIRVSGKMGQSMEKEFTALNKINFALNGKKVK
jgi:hypothetical protein